MSVNQTLCKPLDSGAEIDSSGSEDKHISIVSFLVSTNCCPLKGTCLPPSRQSFSTRIGIIMRVQCWSLLLTGHTYSSHIS